EVLRKRRVAAEPRLLDGAGGNLLQRPRVGIDSTAELRFLGRELAGQLARERRDRLTLQRRDLPEEPLHRRVRGGGPVAQGPTLGRSPGRVIVSSRKRCREASAPWRFS